MSAEIVELTDSDFEAQLANSSGLVFFYKKLCPHCKALRTVLAKFMAANPNVDIMQIDSEENPGAMESLGVEKVPVLLVVRNGNVAVRRAGLMNIRELTTLYKSA